MIEIVLVILVLYLWYRTIRHFQRHEDGMKWVERYDRNKKKYRSQIIDESESYYVRDNFFGSPTIFDTDEFGFRCAREAGGVVIILRTGNKIVLTAEVIM